MAAPSYKLTNWKGTGDPASGILTLIEDELTNAGWTFVEQTSFTQSLNARVMRVWKNPSTLNVAGTDFYVGFVKNVGPGTYLAGRAFEGYTVGSPSTIQRPCIQGNASISNLSLPSTNTWSVAYGNSTFVAVRAVHVIPSGEDDARCSYIME